MLFSIIKNFFKYFEFIHLKYIFFLNIYLEIMSKFSICRFILKNQSLIHFYYFYVNF